MSNPPTQLAPQLPHNMNFPNTAVSSKEPMLLLTTTSVFMWKGSPPISTGPRRYHLIRVAWWAGHPSECDTTRNNNLQQQLTVRVPWCNSTTHIGT